MFCKVRYYKPEHNGYAGQEYLYNALIPVSVGTKVLVPTKNGTTKAIVSEAEVSNADINPLWKDKIRQITEYDNEAGGKKI